MAIHRRLNKAMVECKSQASFTARRLVGQIRTIDRRVGLARKVASANGIATRPTQQLRWVSGGNPTPNRRQFSYNFVLPTAELHHQARSTGKLDSSHWRADDQEEENGPESIVISELRFDQTRLDQLDAIDREARIFDNSQSENEQNYCEQNGHLSDSYQFDEQPQQQVEEFFENHYDDHREENRSQTTKPQICPVLISQGNGCQSQQLKETLRLRGASSNTTSRNLLHKAKIMPLNQKSSQHFVRSSALGGSRRRSSNGRRLSGGRTKPQRQVRFHPIPQSIDISLNRSDDSGPQLGGENEPSSQEPAIYGADKSTKAPRQATTLGNKTLAPPKPVRRVHLSAKPLTRRLHNLSHLKFNKIKLKSFNNLAHQLHQSIVASSYTPNADTAQPSKRSAPEAAATSGNSRSQLTTTTTSGETPSPNNEDDFGWGSDFDEHSMDSSSLTSQQTEASQPQQAHASASAGYLLEIGKSSCDQRAIEDVIQDQGISGQFKRIEVGAGEAGELLASAERQRQQQQQHSHKLMIELERRQQLELQQQQQVVPDRADSTSCQEAAQQAHELQVQEIEVSELKVELQQQQQSDDTKPEVEDQAPEEDEDDEEELRSFEARQGFRQIRDKLKVILDQRLANYERSAASSGEFQQVGSGGANAAAEQPVLEPEPAHCHRMSHHIHRGPSMAAKDAPNCCKSASGHEFDCQSHCSDESSSSSGLESNHSGSQDSGHSTQHSGYSTHSCAIQRGRVSRQLREEHGSSPETQNSSPVESSSSSTDLKGSSSSAGQSSLSPAIVSEPRGQEPVGGGGQASELAQETLEDRRSRFLQNRLIINSKLESMFKSRSPQKAEARARSNSQAALLPLPAPQTSEANKPRTQTASGAATVTRSQTISAGLLAPARNSLVMLHPSVGPEMRSILLEQQRQMSLKLKQKPRRKTAKRVLNPSNVDSNTEEDNGSYASGSSELQRTGSANRKGRDSLTKQLSMICLRQASQLQGQQHAQPSHQQQQQPLHQAASQGSGLQQQQQVGSAEACDGGQPLSLIGGGCHQPRAALSLRQLVKGVIDDCETPNKLSTLTRSILNRSDSLSSELANSFDDVHCRPDDGPEGAKSASSEDQSASSSLSSLSAPTQSANQNHSPSAAKRQAGCDELNFEPVGLVSANSCLLPISPISPLQHSTPTQQHHHHHHHNTSIGLDRSVSSMGSIDGLEYSRHAQSSGDFGQLDPDPRPFQGCHMVRQHAFINQPASRPQRDSSGPTRLTKSTIGSYLKSLREFSRFKMPKAKLTSGGNSDMAVGVRTTVAASGASSDHDLKVGHCATVGHNSSPFELYTSSTTNNNMSSNNNYEYQLEAIGKRAAAATTGSQPEGSNTLAGAWRRRAKRASITMESPVAASLHPATNISANSRSDAFANHFVTISNRKWKSCHLRASLMQIAFNGPAAAADQGGNNEPITPIAAAKQHLAYLENSRNFTDEDNY